MGHWQPSLFLIAFLGCPISGVLGAPEPEAGKYTGKVSALQIAADTLGADWSGPTGLVVDDFEDLSAFPPEVRQTVEELKKQAEPLGVVATADFTYRRKSDPFDQITFKLFVFDSTKSCRDWWQKKYHFEGWEKLYSVVAGLPYDALDSKQASKRIVSFGNVWMTCGSLKKSDEHLKVLDLYVKKVRATIKATARR